MYKFNKLYRKIIENVAGGDSSVFGSIDNSIGVPGGAGDTYAPGDSRIPHALGSKKRKKRKKKKNG